jgi:hypothetical protein
MTPNDWVAIAVGGCAILTSLLLGLRWVIKGWLNELRPNSGNSLKDQISRIDERSLRLEQRVDDLFVLISKS